MGSPPGCATLGEIYSEGQGVELDKELAFALGWLAHPDLAAEDPDKDILLYINSPGGSVTAGMAIYDTMQFVGCDVATVCLGLAASMGQFLLTAGAAGTPDSPVTVCTAAVGSSGGSFTADADLELTVPASVLAGNYTGTITFIVS